MSLQSRAAVNRMQHHTHMPTCPRKLTARATVSSIAKVLPLLSTYVEFAFIIIVIPAVQFLAFLPCFAGA